MSTPKRTRTNDPSRGKTQVKGQNPKANDAPDQDEHHDDNRRNAYDEDVGKSLGTTEKKRPQKE